MQIILNKLSRGELNTAIPCNYGVLCGGSLRKGAVREVKNLWCVP